MVDIAWSQNPSRLLVNTCDLDHPRALGTYQKVGFVLIDQPTGCLAGPTSGGVAVAPAHSVTMRSRPCPGEAPFASTGSGPRSRPRVNEGPCMSLMGSLHGAGAAPSGRMTDVTQVLVTVSHRVSEGLSRRHRIVPYWRCRIRQITRGSMKQDIRNGAPSPPRTVSSVQVSR